MKKNGLIVGAIIIMVALMSTFFIAQENEYCLVRQFGRIERIETTAGLYVKIPFIQSAEKLPKEDQLYDLPSSDVITADKKSMLADCYIIWRISDPLVYYQNLKSISNAEGKIDIIAYNAMKNVISSMTQDEVIQGKDGSLSKKIMDNIGISGSEYGISIEKIEMKLLDLPEDNKEAVYLRMISEREKIVAQYKAEGEAKAKQIENEVNYQVRIMKSAAEKEAQSIIADGEAEYMQILANSYGSKDKEKIEFYKFLRGLEATKKSLPNGSMIIIDDDYAIIDNMKAPNKSAEAETESFEFPIE